MSKKEKNHPGSKVIKKHSRPSIIKGTLDITRSGIGYVIVEGVDKDIFIRPHDFNTAFDGDTVTVIINESAKGKRIEGRVDEVLKRKQTEFIGNIQVNNNFGFFTPDSKKPIPDFYISLKKLNGAKDNDRVVVRLLSWEKGEKKPEGEVVSVLKASDVNDMAMKGILIESGFPLEFEKDVLEETASLADTMDTAEIDKRKDFRKVLTFTIDPVDAKDFDDALSIQKVGDDYEIGVHIADVSHYVKPDTALDISAYDRATSVYLPDRVNPMLPEKISNELCSLRPHEDKLTFSVIFQIDTQAKIKNYWLGKTVIHSDHRFSYDEVQEIIDEKEGLFKDEILLLNRLAQKFRSERFKNGAINFSSTEVKFTLDENGKPIGIVVKESKESHQLIEEFMLLANRTIAAHVAKLEVNQKPIPFPYRIHDTPDEEKLKPFVAFAKKFGYHFNMLDEAAVASSFNKMLQDVKGKPEQHVLEQLGIRTMAKAIYTSENVGHYGLGFEHYCHFTSPIRRYPDVMVHRVLEQIINKEVKPDKKMEVKCKHCSDKERSAMEAERAGNKYKQVEFMMDFVGDEFDGVISGVSSFGFWVETVEQKCEGLVSVRDLSEYDDFRLDETDYALVGLKSGRKFRMGDLIRVTLVSANLSKRQLDFEWVPGAAGKKKSEPGKTEMGHKKKQGEDKKTDKRTKKDFHKKKKK